jgi:ketosteroid isomerase-like protein
MKTRLTFLISLFLSQLALAQQDGTEADKQALRALGASYEKAINSGDLNPLASSLSSTASAVFLTNDEVQGLPAMQAFFDDIKKRLGEGSSYTVKLVPDDTQFFGDTALAHGAADETVRLGNGSSFTYTTRWTALLRKLDGIWKAERLHVSLNPIDNPIVAARSKAQSWLVGVVAALAGIVLGFLMARLRRKA